MKNFNKLLFMGSMIIALMSQSAFAQFPVSIDRMQDSLDVLVERLKTPAGGFSVGVMFKDTILTAGAGFSQIGVAVDEDIRFGLSDATQHFMAALTLKLVEEGTISLSDELGANGGAGNVYIDNPGNAVVFPTSVTIEQLLKHTSGIQNINLRQDCYPNVGSCLIVGQAGTNFSSTTSLYVPVLNEYLPTSESSSAAGASGTFNYSVTNYLVLGEKLETVTGQTIQSLFDTYIGTPAGISDMQFWGIEEQEPSNTDVTFSTLYYNLSGFQPEALVNQTGYLTSTGAAASLTATPKAILKYFKALFNGDILGQSSLDLLTDFQAVNDSCFGSTYSMGTEQITFNVPGAGSRTFIGHWGDLNYQTLIAYRPEDQLGIVVMSNVIDVQQGNEFGCSRTSDLVNEMLMDSYDILISNDDEFVTTFDLNLYPNPANDALRISYELEKTSQVSMDVFTLVGQRVLSVASETQPTGIQQANIEVSELSEGIYTLRLMINGEPVIRKFVVEK